MANNHKPSDAVRKIQEQLELEQKLLDAANAQVAAAYKELLDEQGTLQVAQKTLHRTAQHLAALLAQKEASEAAAVRELELLHADLQREQTKHRHQEMLSQQRIQQLQEREQQAKAEADSLAAGVAQLQKQLQEAEDVAEERARELDQLHSRTAALTLRVEQEHANQATLKRARDQATAQARQLAVELETLRSESRAKVAALEQELARLRHRAARRPRVPDGADGPSSDEEEKEAAAAEAAGRAAVGAAGQPGFAPPPAVVAAAAARLERDVAQQRMEALTRHLEDEHARHAQLEADLAAEHSRLQAAVQAAEQATATASHERSRAVQHAQALELELAATRSRQPRSPPANPSPQSPPVSRESLI